MRYFAILFTLVFSLLASAQSEQIPSPRGRYVRFLLCNNGTIYAATGGGVRLSHNHGNSWSFSNSGLSSLDTKSLASIGDTVFVSTDENVFRTANGGQSWEPCGDELQGFYCKL